MRALLVKEFMILKTSGLQAIKKDNLAPGVQCLLEGRLEGITV